MKSKHLSSSSSLLAPLRTHLPRPTRTMWTLCAWAITLAAPGIAQAQQVAAPAHDSADQPATSDDELAEKSAADADPQRPSPPSDESKLSKDEASSPTKVTAKNTLYLELFGPGLLYSLNYERRIVDLNLRVGFGGAAWQGSGYFVVPMGANYIGIGNDTHHLELGGTATLIFADAAFSTASTIAIQPIIGYRRQPKEGGYNLRAGISPWIGSRGILPWGYVSFGATF